jgi:amino acid transporter
MADTPRELPRVLGLADLILFNLAALVSVRWLATAAAIGAGSLTLWAAASLLFFLPLALCVAHLSFLYPEEGGLYAWTGRALGPWHGFLCGWLYWLSNLTYFPNLVLAGSAMALYMGGSQGAALAENRGLVVALSLALWLALLTNLVGLRWGKWTQNAGAVATYALGAVLLVAGLYAWLSAAERPRWNFWPEWNWGNVNLWSQIAFAFGGLELGSFLGGEVRDARRTLRRAAYWSGGLTAAFYMLGTLALLALLPGREVSVVTGLAQAGQAAGERLAWPWLGPALAALIFAGVAGQLGAWMTGAARLAFVIGLDRYLPPAFGRLHPKWKTPHVALLTQGVACTVLLLAMLAGESLRAGYQVLVDITVLAYFVPFAYLFATAWKHGKRLSAAAGGLITLLALALTFVPPAGVASAWLFEAKLAGSLGLLVGAARYFYLRARQALSPAN